MQHQRCEDEEELEVEEEEEELRDRGAMCFDNFKNSSNDAVSLAPLQVRKGFCLRGHVGYYSKSQVQLTRCLRGAYAELTRNVAIVLGNYNQKNRTIKKTHKETIVEGQSLTLICTCHTCAYAQCLRSTFLTKPLTPPCANQGFAYAKCSYDKAKALIKTIQNGFWGRSFVGGKLYIAMFTIQDGARPEG